MSHSRTDVINHLRHYSTLLHHVGLFPELHTLDRNVNRRVFIGFEDITRMTDVAIYTLATKCCIFHMYCSNFFWAHDLDLAQEIVARSKVLYPGVEHDVNVWLAAFTTSTVPYRWVDSGGVSNWHVYGSIPWNYSA